MTLFFHLLFGSIALLWALGMLKILGAQRDPRFRVTNEDPGPPTPTRVTVVVPARNEVGNIEACVRSALAQDLPGVRVVVIDDGSTDGTSSVLSDLAADHPALTVVTGGENPLPEGWLGKPWACQRAGEAALAQEDPPDWLLFTDADVRLDPAALRAALGYAHWHGVDMLSGLGTMVMESFWERVLQPIVIGMILNGNDMDRVNDPDRSWGNPIANGQFILLKAEAWRQVEGHAAVRANVLDDVGMAKAVETAGLRLHMVFMRTLFRCRMYDSLESLWEGWTKNLFAGMNRSWPTLLGVVAINLVMSVLPYAALLLGLVGVLGPVWAWWGGACVFFIQCQRLYLDVALQNRVVFGLTHVLGCTLLTFLLLNSGLQSVRGTATWKGRTLPKGA